MKKEEILKEIEEINSRINTYECGDERYEADSRRLAHLKRVLEIRHGT